MDGLSSGIAVVASFAFLVIAIVAAVLGFVVMGSSAMFFARVMVVIFLLLSIMAFMVEKFNEVGGHSKKR